LYYNNPADLNGSSDIDVNMVSAYSNINFIRGGKNYAVYHGGGTPMAAMGGGRFTWQ
jgi:hypothetical protein